MEDGHIVGRRKFLNLLGAAPFVPLPAALTHSTQHNVSDLDGIWAALRHSTQHNVSDLDGIWVDIRDYGAVVSGGNITAALQATINAIGSSGELKTIMIPLVGGRLTVDALNLPAPTGGVGWKFLIGNSLLFTSTLTIPGSTTIIGLTHRSTGSILQEPTGISIKGDLNPIFKLTSTNCLLKNIYFESQSGSAARGTHVLIQKTSCITLENIGTTSTNGKSGLHVDQSFWINIRDCICQSDTSGLPSILLDANDTGASEGVGIIVAKNILLSGDGIKISPHAGATSGGFQFEDVTIENAHAGGSVFYFDSTDRNITDINLSRIGIADSPNPQYTIKNTGVQTHGVIIRQTSSPAIDPTSTFIYGLEMDSHSGDNWEGQSAATPSYSYINGRNWPESIDKMLVCAPRGPQTVVGGTILNIPQTYTSWPVSGGVTSIVAALAPDGTMNAGAITGTGSAVSLIYQTGPSYAVGDWYIFGCWIQDQTGTTGFGNGMQIEFNWGTSNAGRSISGLPSAANQVSITDRMGLAAVNDSSWKWFCRAYKFVGVGTGTLDLRVQLAADNRTLNYYNPCGLYFAHGSGFTDYDIMALARSYRGGWSSTASPGQVAILDHQTFRAGAALTTLGAVSAYSATAIPAGGSAGAGLTVSSVTNFGVFFGSGAPSLSAAKGSLYLRSDGSTTNDRMYVNTNGSTMWTAVTTVT